MFTSLHNHCYASNIRFTDSINRPKEMVEKALELGFNGLALTDHEALSAHVDFLHVRDKVEQEHSDFKFIFGNEIYLIPDNKFKADDCCFYHFILLAKDLTGYQQIRQLSSRAWERSYMGKGIRRCPTFYSDIEEIVGKNSGHIIASSACLGSQIDKAILAKDKDVINTFIPWCINQFGRDNFYLEMQVADSEEQTIVNKFILKLSKCFNIKYIITSDSHYLNKEDFKLFTEYLNSKSNSDRETELFYKYTYLVPVDEMYQVLISTGLTKEQIDVGIQNTDEIGAKIERFDFRHSTIVPKIPLPEFHLKHLLKEYYEKYPAIKEVAYSDSLQNQYMLYLIEKGIEDKHYQINEKVAARLQEEIDVILYISEQLKEDISAYLNLVQKIVDLCWKVSVVGVSRGSAGAFLTNYLMGITQMDPLVYGIPSFRFLNKARADSLPDVDIDVDPNKNDEIVQILKDYFGEKNVINCATFKTEKLKSAVLNSARALGYNNDEAQAIAALVPAERGIQYSLKDCEEGNDEQGFNPVPQFIAQLKSYPGLYEMVKKVEGLPTNASIHASALYLFNNGYDANNSLMRAPNGVAITGLNMHDSDECSALKMDLLKTDAETKIMKCLEIMLQDGAIEWQGDLKSTYYKYVHPDNLIYTDNEMWERATNNQILSLFQMNTSVGQAAMKKMRPQTVEELATVNGLIRLTGGGDEESPVDRYARFKQDINLWYQEMEEFGLTQEEQQILRKHLDFTYGLCYNQESFMQLLMDPKISNFSLKDADKGRKILSKKKVKEIAGFKEKFLTSTATNHQEFKDYVWHFMIEPQMRYSFNRAHGVGYSLIGVQEMNLATRWSPLYWACAVLCIDSGNATTNFEEQDDDNIIIEEENEAEEENTEKKKFSTPNYIKISSAISEVQKQNINVEVPNINTSKDIFFPDVQNNAILYGLSAVTDVNYDLYERIINNRPYTKISEFIIKVEPTYKQMLSLIKAGCFDKLLNKSRRTILKMYFAYLAKQKVKPIEKPSLTNVKKMFEEHLNFPQWEEQRRLYEYKKFISTKQLDPEDSKRYIISDKDAIIFFVNNLKLDFVIGKDYTILPNNTIGIKKTAFDKIYKQKLQPILDWLGTPAGAKAYNSALASKFAKDLEGKDGQGSVASWEMSTLSYYHEEHELAHISKLLYDVKDFEKLPENSEKNDNVCYIAGTVIGTDNLKKVVSVLTPTGVVPVKVFGDNYVKYNQKLSKIENKNGKSVKTVIEESWFKRGTLLMVYGQRRENMFLARNGGYKIRPFKKINHVNSDGTLELQEYRKKVEE